MGRRCKCWQIVAQLRARTRLDAELGALTEELIGSTVRITSVYPGIIEETSPLDPNWDHDRGSDGTLSDRDVVEAILFILAQPRNVAIRSLVIERARTDFLS